MRLSVSIRVLENDVWSRYLQCAELAVVCLGCCLLAPCDLALAVRAVPLLAML